MKKSSRRNKKSVLKYLKHFFISGKHNSHKPHIFRNFFLLSFLFVGAFFLGVSYGSNFFFNKTVLGANIASNILVDLTNNDRVANSLTPLRINEKLNLASRLKNEDMVKNNYFAHNSPQGLTPWYFMQLAGYNFLYAGENLAINFTEAKDVENAWMKSPLHRENLLSDKFQEIGINVSNTNDKSNERIQIVQMFGTPAVEDLTPTETAPASLREIKVKIIQENKNTSTVKNESPTILEPATTTIPTVPTIAGRETYSTLGERLFFESPKYVQIIFYFLIIMLALSLLGLTLVEFKRHHYKHIFYGISLIIVLFIFTILNSTIL